MTVGLLTEKPSQARAFAQALGGMSGTYNGESYVITHARGHLYELAEPQDQIPGASPEEREKLRKWDLENLPWDLDRFEWKYVPIDGTSQLIANIKKTFAGCDEIVAAGDVDPSGEGGLIFSNVVLALGLDKTKKLSRMYFTDESAASVQKAFTSRKPISSIQDFDEYRMASFRSAVDFGTIQFTRVATAMARSAGKNLMLRQGRLKSAMVQLVGDQLKAYNDYVKKPFFQNRFRDENGVVYTNPEEPRFDKKAQVPQQYRSSAVVKDGTATKTTAPPKLLDLAGLSTVLVSKGIAAKTVLETYQKMYEYTSPWPGVGKKAATTSGVVSYPRTEDRTITPEQFAELVPFIDQIAGVVGVDVSHLTHRQPRSTHVKPKGAHGANRPGTNVPPSLDAVEQNFGKAGRLIYETLAKNYLAMICEDYVYEQQKGHVKDYPDFVGIANVPQKPGWRAVYDPDAGDSADDKAAKKDAESDSGVTDSAKGLGTQADPFVFEGANKRPPHPTMKWLMTQLEKRDVGTGATRTSTYSDVTNARTKYPLLVEKRGGKLTLAEPGELSWRLLPNTHIGDLALTEKVTKDMKAVADGSADADQLLAQIADWVRADIETMKENAKTMIQDLGLTAQGDRATGVWAAFPGGPREIRFKRVFSGHTFTDDEVEKLLAGEEIEFDAVSARTGRTFRARGKLAVKQLQGDDGKTVKYVGFDLVDRPRADKPTTWAGVTFTTSEVAKLMDGEKVTRSDFVSAKGNAFAAAVIWDKEQKKIVPDFGSDTEPPRSFCQHVFTEAERKKLAAGGAVEASDFVSKKGNTFAASVTWTEVDGKKKLVLEFAPRR